MGQITWSIKEEENTITVTLITGKREPKVWHDSAARAKQRANALGHLHNVEATTDENGNFVVDATKHYQKGNVKESTDLDLRALSIKCPLCGAGMQKPCRNEQGKNNSVPHMARIDAYRRAFDLDNNKE